MLTNQKIPTEEEIEKTGTPEDKKLFHESKFSMALQFKKVLSYITGHAVELQNDLERIKKKCDLFRKNGLCGKCVFCLEGQCVFWDVHYKKYMEIK